LSIVGVGLVVEGLRVGVGRRGTTLARGEDELCRGSAVACQEEHVAAGAVQQLGEYLTGRVGAVFAEDTLVYDASCDFDAGLVGDLTEDLVEAGVVGGDGEDAVGEGDLGVLWLLLSWSERYGWSERRGGSERRGCAGGGCGGQGGD
jgi:hypothetical protein